VGEFLIGVGAFFAWVVLWALAAGLFTMASVAAAGVLEQKLLVPERYTFLLWVAALAVCPAVAFGAQWTLFGLMVSGGSHAAVRFGGLAAGLAYVVIGVLLVNRPGEREDKKEEVTTLLASGVVDLACCLALVWLFDPISRYMAGLGG